MLDKGGALIKSIIITIVITIVVVIVMMTVHISSSSSPPSSPFNFLMKQLVYASFSFDSVDRLINKEESSQL